MMTLSVTLIGLGAIGSEILAQLRNDKGVRIAQVLVRAARQQDTQELVKDACAVITSIDALDPATDFVLECAGHRAVAEYGVALLDSGFDFGISSTGALADDDLRQSLTEAALRTGAQITLLPGAIGGTDALAAAGPDGLEHVTYTGRKPPMSWSGSHAERTHDLERITTPTEIFSGTAGDAARLFPKNANVVATVAMAGIGFDRTRVTLVADPGAQGNAHHIEARGPVLSGSYTTVGQPLADNPKSSALTASSAVRLLRNRARPLVV
jgi:aspartate dehydrogenase